MISAHAYGNILASMDVEGTVIVRDLRAHDIISTIRLNKPYESGQVLFNHKMKDELFVFYNNEMELYSIDGSQIQKRDFDQNITHAI